MNKNNIYKVGQDRHHTGFFPPTLEDSIAEDNPVRAIDAYIEALDMVSLGFTNTTLSNSSGQPAYHPKLLLKIYIYGYLNKVRSSRKLDAEIKRNIEMMWLCQGLQPGYKTIANFRKDNAKALEESFKTFVLLCKELGFIGGQVVAVDGAFLRANASKNKLLMKKTLEKDIKRMDTRIKKYLETLTTEDTKDEKLQALLEKKRVKDEDLEKLNEMKSTQYNRTDPDAKLMVKPAHNLMAYNCQIAVDSTYKFIVSTQVSSDGTDYGKIHDIAVMTNVALDINPTYIADSGYYSHQEIAKCEADKIPVYVPVPKKQNKTKKQPRFIQGEFIYNETEDHFVCPNNQILPKTTSFNTKNDGSKSYFYRSSTKNCRNCDIRDQCIPEKTAYKQLGVSEYFSIAQAHQEKMQTDEAKEYMKQRSALAEHPFGTIKQNLGWTHYLVRGLEKVSGENALIILTYNIKRLLNIIGVIQFQKLMIAIKNGDKSEIEAIKAKILAFMAYFWFKIHFFVLLIDLYFKRVLSLA